jgi:hypothetical protein
LNAKELPLLLYPIGDLDDDPESCIYFSGYLPVAKEPNGRPYRRAITTIRFFDLDVRENLLRQRCELIVSLYRALIDSTDKNDPKRQKDGDGTVKRLVASQSAHSNCARSYYALFIADIDRAFELFQEANQFAFKGPGTTLLERVK